MGCARAISPKAGQRAGPRMKKAAELTRRPFMIPHDRGCDYSNDSATNLGLPSRRINNKMDLRPSSFAA